MSKAKHPKKITRSLTPGEYVILKNEQGENGPRVRTEGLGIARFSDCGHVIHEGRQVWWIRNDEEYTIHTGDPDKAINIGPWDRAQAYLEGGPNPCI